MITTLEFIFDNFSTELMFSAPSFLSIVTVNCLITDDSSATALDSFYVKVKNLPTAIDEFNNVIPIEYALGQNYPNPFNPSTKIIFSLPLAGDVKIVIYNTIGQKVATLFDGFKQAGYHSVLFDAGHLSSGVYFYSMQSEKFSKIKKMILIK